MQTGDRIKALSVANFKSVGHKPQGIEIRPLTILAGVNSSGKSTLMQPLLLVKQTLESPFDPGPLLLNGPHVQFTDASQFMSMVPGADRKSTSFWFQAGELIFGLRFGYSRSRELSVETNEFDTTSGERHVIEANELDGASFRGKFFLLDGRTVRDGRPSLVSGRHNLFVDLFQRVLHVPGIRGNPLRLYPRTAADGHIIGTFVPYTASAILDWQSGQGQSNWITLVEWLMRLGLTDHLEVQPVDGVSVEVMVGRHLAGARTRRKLVSIADVGFGVSQVLPALVACLAARPGDLVYIEQPELHLHPNSQVALALVLADASRRGASIVVETHSSLLIQGIQTLIAEGNLDPGTVALHWCSRDPKTGATKVTTAELDENGAYGDWPIDFDTVELSAQSRYLDAVSHRRNH